MKQQNASRGVPPPTTAENERRPQPGRAGAAENQQRDGGADSDLSVSVDRFPSFIDLVDPEVRLLGAAMQNAEAARVALAGLEVGDFMIPVNRALFLAIRAALRAGPVDPWLVMAELHRLDIPAPSERNWAIVVADAHGGQIVPAAVPAYRRKILDQRVRDEIARQTSALSQEASRLQMPELLRSYERATRAVSKVLERRAHLDRGQAA